MDQHVSGEGGRSLERLQTHSTLERLLVRVDDHVLLQTDGVVEDFIANITTDECLTFALRFWLWERGSYRFFQLLRPDTLP